MVPRLGRTGTSFKGALAYYMHDKGPDGAPKATTADRVAWTATRNMITDDIDTATRIMIATAMQAQDLKAAAGIEATGRKSAKSVFHYSLAWHDEENGKIDRAEMMRAAESSLIALGAEHLQAVIVCHQDEDHPHVHIVLNRVMDDGKLFNPSYTKETLSRWAYAYREARGEHLKYCPERHAKMERSRKGREIEPDPVKRAEHVKGKQAEQSAKMQREPTKAAQIAARRDELKAKHKREWEALGAVYRARKDAAWKHHPSFKAIAAQHRADTRADWSTFGKAQAEERRNFRHNEKKLAGVFYNALKSAVTVGAAGRGFLGAVFRYALSAGSRKAAFDQHLAQGKAVFAAQSKAQLDGKIAAAKAEHAGWLKNARDEYLAKRADLQARQRLEMSGISEAWKAYYAERDQSNGFRAPQNVAQRQQEQKPVKNEFENARKLDGHKPPERTATAPVAAPQPTPMGAAPAPVQRQAVPTVDRAADFAATPKGQEVVGKQAEKAAPDALRTKAAEPFKPAPTAAPAKDIWAKSATPEPTQRPTDVWNEKAKPTAERRHRDRSKDLDFDLDR